jgi:ATP-dependent Zn protease
MVRRSRRRELTPEQFERAKRLFAEAEALPEQERAALLERQCLDDPEVRGLVAKLLAQPTEP